MYESSPRSREVANALLQLDRLSEDQVRAVLRHITIDDAVLNEAQCSHIANLISGTLHKVPREGVNATLTCGNSLDAASHWERTFASHPGHVSATFRKNSINLKKETDQSKQVVLFTPEETTPEPSKNESTGVNPSLGFNQDLKGLTIVNKGQITLHYHSYNDTSSPTPQTAATSRKRALDRADDEEYSEALASLMEFDVSPQSRRNPPPNSKRQRLEEPDIEMEEPEFPKLEDPEKQPVEGTVEKNKQKQDLACKKCGEFYKGTENKGSSMPCCSHPGKFKHYRRAVKPKGKKGKDIQPLHDAWTCCHNDLRSVGCVVGKHEREDPV
ncbi:hypothetical protein DHEL01_v212619 [Diaporthe helianthi]|uniref:Uncharacterized protein n=1 Tax=Diaporthe helianthi TaxID=158607 RepID=A0A2P5HFG5_DIAHE|nr:hypothetical protein DHEL01_v212619 [Diaporthe helianthi]